MPQSLELGHLQQQILKHFFTCNEEKETVSHISKQVGSLQPAVFRSITSLIKKGYVVKEKDDKNVERYLRLTPKGLAGAALLGLSLEELRTYDEQQRRPSSLVHLLLEVMRDAGKKDMQVHRAAEYILKNKFFESNDLNTRNRINFLAILLADSIIRVDQNLTLLELVKRFDLDTESVRKVLLNKKHNIELLLRELNATVTHDLVNQPIGARDETSILLNKEGLPVLERELKPSPPEFDLYIDEALKSEIDRLWKPAKKGGSKSLKLHIKEGKLDNISVDLTSKVAQKSRNKFISIQK